MMVSESFLSHGFDLVLPNHVNHTKKKGEQTADFIFFLFF